MYIYKFTHIDSGRSYIGQTIQDPNHRRLEHISGSRYSEKTYHFHNAIKKYGIDSFIFEVIDKKDGGAMLGKTHPNKGGTSSNKGKKQGMTWEEIYGIEGAANRRQAHATKALSRKSGG